MSVANTLMGFQILINLGMIYEAAENMVKSLVFNASFPVFDERPCQINDPPMYPV